MSRNDVVNGKHAESALVGMFLVTLSLSLQSGSMDCSAGAILKTGFFGIMFMALRSLSSFFESSMRCLSSCAFAFR